MSAGPTLLLVGRRREVLEETAAAVTAGAPTVRVEVATTVEEAAAAMDREAFDHVVSGAALDLPTRLRLVEHVFTVSDTTAAHLKDLSSGPHGLAAFALAALGATSSSPVRHAEPVHAGLTRPVRTPRHVGAASEDS